MEVDPNQLTEVDKTFYELQIADLNRKLARLRSLTTELTQKNEELQQSNEKLDEDRADVITYLKRILQEKSDEIRTLNERLEGLKEARELETQAYEEKVVQLQEEYTMMKEQLNSDLKLLGGKLNALEEFRLQRDDIMKKYELQEQAMEDQEIQHKREIYDIERKFIIGKDRLKKDMEERLLKLSTEFQDATNLRIAATTHRVIRENIAINNELNVILETYQRLQKENEELKEKDHLLRIEAQLHEAEKKKALRKSNVQDGLITRLTQEHSTMRNQLTIYQNQQNEELAHVREIKTYKDLTSSLQYKVGILEQNLHACRCDRTRVQTELEYSKEEVKKLSRILCEAVVSIEEVLNVKMSSDTSLSVSKRENLLVNLLALLGKVHDEVALRPSLETVSSFTSTYAKGDLGFVPKPVVLRSQFPTLREIQSQVGPSFESFVMVRSDGTLCEKYKELLGEEEEFLSEDRSAKQLMDITSEDKLQMEKSEVFFDDEPEALSTPSEGAKEIDLTVIDFPKLEITTEGAEDEQSVTTTDAVEVAKSVNDVENIEAVTKEEDKKSNEQL